MLLVRLEQMSLADESHQAFHRGTAPIFALLSPEQTRQLAELHGDPSLAERLTELAEKANEGELSDSERTEYEAYIAANNILAALQAEARFRVGHSEPRIQRALNDRRPGTLRRSEDHALKRYGPRCTNVVQRGRIAGSPYSSLGQSFSRSDAYEP